MSSYKDNNGFITFKVHTDLMDLNVCKNFTLKGSAAANGNWIGDRPGGP